MAVVFAASIRPMPEADFVYSDKFFHLAAYAVMGWLAARAFAPPARPATPAARPPGWLMLVSMGMTFSFGVLIEVCQSYVPARTGDPVDAIANGVGGVIGVYAWSRVMPLVKERIAQR